MTEWRLHWLEAEGDLSAVRNQVVSEFEVARAAVSQLLELPALDILVQRLPGQVIPEIGMNGYAMRKSLFALTLDPENPNFSRSLVDGTLRRQIVHEVHHCLRIAGPGYGRTLGEALVSEGLAGRFVSHLFATPPELWESAVDRETLAAYRPSATALAAADYDHAAWFFGTKDGRYPRWLGYTLGYDLVGEWLRQFPDADGPTWVNIPASAVLSASST